MFPSIFCLLTTVSVGIVNATPNNWNGSIFDAQLSKIHQTAVDVRPRSAAIDICKSRDFELRVENWFISEALDWLQEYTLLNQDTENFQQRGIIGAIAYDYLGENGIKCGLKSPSLCKVDCVDVVRSVGDLQEARRVYFVLKSAQHLNLVFDIVQQNVLAAQNNIGLWAPKMSRLFFWSEPSTYEKTHKLLLGYLNVFLQMVIASATAWVPGSSIIGFAENSWEIAKVNCDVLAGELDKITISTFYEKMAADLLDMQKERDFRKQILDRVIASGAKRSYAETQWYAAASPWFAVMAPQAMFDAIGTYTVWEGQEDSPERNAENLMVYIQKTAEVARINLFMSVDSLFAGKEVDSDGSTPLSRLIGAGGYLPTTSDALAQWTGPEAERKITRSLLLKVVDGALKSQTLWISCTKDYHATGPRKNSYSEAKYPTTTCRRDLSGPQDLKECVDDYVCYMYKWDSRGSPHTHQVERPYGLADLAEAPFDITVQDIIYSSVKTYLQDRDGEPSSLDIMAYRDHASAEELWNSRAPGAFSIPVCISKYNWMTPVEPVYDINCGANPYCRKKNIPCNCGPWGSETKEVWQESGLWDHPSSKSEYRQWLCPRQIDVRIKDSLERYVAYCRLDIRKSGFGGIITKAGEHTTCGAVVKTIEEAGNPPLEEMSPILKMALECAAGLISRRKCKSFMPLLGQDD